MLPGWPTALKQYYILHHWKSLRFEVGPDVAYGCQMGVVNRDIKLENTLLDSSRRPLLKICDFGYSKHQKDSLPKSKVGTPGYTGEHRYTSVTHVVACLS